MKTVVYNGKIYVERGQFVQAVLIEDGMVLRVGTNEEIFDAAEDAAVSYDCDGKTVIPGLNDSHLHFMQFGEKLYQAQIEGSLSIDDLVKRCQTFITDHPERVTRGLHALGWNQDLFIDEKRMPNRHDLDRISREIPVVLERICGHALVTNTKALEMMGLSIGSPQIPGGAFYLEEDGYPNGIFTENACAMAKALIPPFTLEEQEELLAAAMEYGVSHGLTSVQSNDVGISFETGEQAIKVYQNVYDAGKGKLRVHHQVCFNDEEGFRNFLEDERCKALRCGEGHGWLTIGPLKLFKDGSLGARTALMKNGYVGDRDNHGIDCMSKDTMESLCRLAADNHMQVVTHAIGDEAISQVMDCYEKTFWGEKNPLRHGLVHCQITDRSLLKRIVENHIPVLAQPIFLDYDMTIVEQLCGKELTATSYAFGTLLEMGANLSYGTDCPVEDCNPFPNIYMAVTRKNREGEPTEGFYPKECVDVEMAIDAYTLQSAYVQFMEERKGRLKPGYYGDLVVLDRDIFTIDEMEIKDILPVMTMVDGKIVYQK